MPPVGSPTDPPAPAPSPPSNVPVASPDTASAKSGMDAFVAVLDNDVPATGETLLVQSIERQAENGFCSVGLDLSEVVYTPDQGFAGTDSCVYEACDGEKVCDDATLTVTISGR